METKLGANYKNSANGLTSVWCQRDQATCKRKDLSSEKYMECFAFCVSSNWVALPLPASPKQAIHLQGFRVRAALQCYSSFAS